MSDTITTLLVQIKGDATGVVTAFKDFVASATTANTQISVVNKSLSQTGQALQEAGDAADKAGGHVHGLTFMFRSFFDSLRFGIEGNPMAAFYTVDEGLRGLLASGIGLGALVPVLGAVGVAIAGIAAVWEPFVSQEREMKQQTIDLNEALARLPQTLKQIQDAASVGLLGQGEANKLSQFLTGADSYKIQMPVNQALRQGRITQAQADAAIDAYDKTPEAGQQSLFMSQFNGNGAMVTVEANMAERAKMTNDQLVKQGYLMKELDDKGKETGKYVPTAAGQALLEEMKLQKQMYLDSLSGIAREREAAKQKFDEQMDHIRVLDQTARAVLPGGQTEAQQKLLAAIPGLTAYANTAYKNTLQNLDIKQTDTAKTIISPDDVRDKDAKDFAQTNQQIENQITDKALAASKERESFWQEESKMRIEAAERALFSGEISEDQYKDAVRVAQQEILAGEQKQREELERQAQLKRDVARQDIEDQIEAAKSNPLMLNADKLEIISQLQEQLKKVNEAEIQDLETLKSQAKSLSDQLELQKKIAELKSQNRKLDEQPTPQQQGSFSFQFGHAITDQMNKWTTWAQESAASFQKAWNGATNSVADGFTHLFLYGAQKGQWFRELWNGMISSIVGSMTQMAVNWVANHVVMEGVSLAFHAAETALTQAGVTQHAVAEEEKTIVSAASSLERQAIYLAETVFHGVMVALRLAAHIAGEAAATAITAVQAVARAFYYAVVAAIGAMGAEAAIPYVGPALAIAAAGAILGVAHGLMGGFAEGGYTGNGHPSEIAGVVHRGEYVIPASRVNPSSMPLLHAIRNGELAGLAAPHSGAAGTFAPPQRSGGAPASTGQQHITHNAIYMDKQKMVNELSQSDAHEKYIVDVMARNIHKFKS